MKYDAMVDFDEEVNGEKIYRDCVFINKNNWDIIDEEEGKNTIIDIEKDVPKDCFIVDKKMANIVRDLNRKGYKTLYSCQGHYDRDSETTFVLSNLYVTFELGDKYQYFLKNLVELPRAFHFEITHSFEDVDDEIAMSFGFKDPNENNLMVGIYANSYYVDNIHSVEEYNIFNRMELCYLQKWVDKLPNITDKYPIEALYDERVIDHNTAQQCGFDFESVQEYAEDIKESYNIAADSIKEINENMSVISDMITHIGKRLAAMKVVDDIRDIDDTSMSKSATPISPEEVKNAGEKYADTTVHIKDLVNKACEESYNERYKECFDSNYGFMNIYPPIR